MAQVFAPGVAQLRLVGRLGVNSQAQVLHFYGGSTAPWTQGQINTLATTAFTSLNTHLSAQFGNNTWYDYAEAIDLTDATQRIAKTTAPAFSGTGTPPLMPLSASIMVSHHIGARYRGGHPRTYFPPAPVSVCPDGDTWSPSFVASFQGLYQNFLDDILAALQAAGLGPAQHCAPRYKYTYTADATKHKFVKERTSYIGPFPVTQSLVSGQVRTQRRRLGP